MLYFIPLVKLKANSPTRCSNNVNQCQTNITFVFTTSINYYRKPYIYMYIYSNEIFVTSLSLISTFPTNKATQLIQLYFDDRNNTSCFSVRRSIVDKYSPVRHCPYSSQCCRRQISIRRKCREIPRYQKSFHQQ